MYDILKSEFESQFKQTELDFDKSLDAVMIKAKEQGNPDVILNVARQLLSDILADYAKSHATTLGGKIGRFFSGIGSFFVKYVNIGSIFKKK